MKRWHFPLRPVGVLRAHRLAVARNAMATAATTVNELTDRIAAKQAGLQGLTSQQAEARAATFRAAAEIAFWGNYRRELTEVTQLERVRVQAVSDLAAKRAACIEADRAVKMIERLEQTALAAHRVESLRHMQNEMDEFAGHRARRGDLFHD